MLLISSKAVQHDKLENSGCLEINLTNRYNTKRELALIEQRSSKAQMAAQQELKLMLLPKRLSSLSRKKPKMDVE
jgi:hypothetical protein